MAIKNFFEKLVYLYKASVDTIQQFGLGYFLRFGSGQLKKQKLDIFKPNEDYDEILSKKPVDKKTLYSHIQSFAEISSFISFLFFSNQLFNGIR